MFGRILFQDIWRLGLQWDDKLPQDVMHKCEKWVLSAASLGDWKIDRCYFPFLKWNSLTDIELHAFGDASEKGYGACVYIRTCLPAGAYKAALVRSKSRVAPIKTITLPRLELMGALLSARLMGFVQHALHLNLMLKYFAGLIHR